jgi:very-short-patch-repair endonuclease
MFLSICKSLKLPLPIHEYRFCERRWRIDFAWPNIKLAVEIEGGAWTRGRHTRGKGFVGDMEKYNRLTEEGWYLLRYQPSSINWDQITKVINSLG